MNVAANVPNGRNVTERTFTWTGPPSCHSMVAQIMLRYGFRRDDAVPYVRIALTQEEDWSLRVTAGGQTVAARHRLPDRARAGRALQDAMSALTGQPLGAWGYLIGMRPSKVLHPFFAAEDYDAAARAFLEEARVAPHERELLLEIGALQREYVATDRQEVARRAAVYIGIPLCPSHCSYCSFPARIASLTEDWQRLTDDLCRDVVRAGELMKRQRLTADSIYYGGGTPTVLPAPYFERLLQTVADALPQAAEYTVEAGRPDTIDDDKLHAMIRTGVTRISINPQTLQDRLLVRIHRAHSAADVEQMYRAVRALPFTSVNMDLIAGLPGQTVADMRENIATLIGWRPENITVHTLAIKRHSPLAAAGAAQLPSAADVATMQRESETALRAAGYLPYYIYRQKYMTADLANIGYTLPGHVCRYNIQMMAERMHIVGIGPGATNKVLRNEAFQFARCYFPWDADVYHDRQEDYMNQRDDLFASYMTKGERV